MAKGEHDCFFWWTNKPSAVPWSFRSWRGPADAYVAAVVVVGVIDVNNALRPTTTAFAGPMVVVLPKMKNVLGDVVTTVGALALKARLKVRAATAVLDAERETRRGQVWLEIAAEERKSHFADEEHFNYFFTRT